MGATTGVERQEINNGRAAMKTTFTLREVIFLFTLLLTGVGGFFSLRADMGNMHEAMQQMREEMREQRQMIEKLLSR